ncbi:hypothetical protein PR048_008421 [Dryococelus australis]|uniref:Uncharacterized protein n=1 Tax=Dryococelus australis TaxID=614101 RepID=A0ABQ9HX24_9NEOP|nr:hypothetical protein PR048_008421 [Dryococelus australis]
MKGRGKRREIRENPPNNGIVRHDSHLRKSGLLASKLSESGSIPGFSHVGIVPDDATGRRVFSGISPPPTFHSSTASYSPHFALIGSQNLDVKNRLNLSTPRTLSLHTAEDKKVDQSNIRLKWCFVPQKRGNTFESGVNKLHGTAKMTANDPEDQYDEFGEHTAAQPSSLLCIRHHFNKVSRQYRYQLLSAVYDVIPDDPLLATSNQRLVNQPRVTQDKCYSPFRATSNFSETLQKFYFHDTPPSRANKT